MSKVVTVMSAPCKYKDETNSDKRYFSYGKPRPSFSYTKGDAESKYKALSDARTEYNNHLKALNIYNQ